MKREIKEEDGQFCVYSADGSDKIACHATKEEAEKQLAAIEADKADEDGEKSTDDGDADDRGAKVGQLFHRCACIRSEDVAEDAGTVRLIASTDEPVSVGGYREVLSHDPSAIDYGSARSLLLNHDRNQIIGGVKSIEIKDGRLMATVDIAPSAKTMAGTSVRELVKSGALFGVSIGYQYDSRDSSYDEDTNTVVARKWSLREITLTPTQADLGAHVVRSLPSHFRSSRSSTTTAAQLAAPEQGAHMGDKKELPQADTSTANEADRAKQIADSREAERKATARTAEIGQIVKLATSYGLAERSAEFIDPAKHPTLDSALDAMIKVKAERDAKHIGLDIGGAARVTVDQADKARDAIVGALLSNAGFKDQKSDLKGRGILDLVRFYARANGERGAEDWSRKDLAWYALGKREMISGARDIGGAAAVTTGSFASFVFLNAITKAVTLGFEQGGRSINYQRISSVNRVPDFKQFSLGTLAAGNLTQTAEDVAFPELDKSEGVYSSTVKMWGATMTLTLQALVSDDTAQFERNLRNAGVIAQKTINKRVFQKLLMGTSTSEATSTWTNNTTVTGALSYTTVDLMAAARHNLGLGRKALMVKTGLDGNPLNTIPSIIIVPPTIAQEVRGIIGGIAPGQQSLQEFSLDVVESAWLEASSLIGNSTSTFYLMADPAEVSGMMVSYVNGMETPQVIPFDPGAVAAVKWKIFQPFEADMINHTIGGNSIIAAAQQGTAS